MVTLNGYEWERIEKCPICGGSGEPLPKVMERKTVIKMDSCANCGLRYQNPMMTEDSIFRYYESGDYLDLHPVSALMEQARAERSIHILDENKITPKRVLDVGSSYGYFLMAVRDRYGAEILGIEPYIGMSNVAEAIKDKSGVNGKFDLINCTQTLEHLNDPVKEMRWMASKLREGGHILIEVPILNKVKLAHPYIFSRESMRLLMEKNGLEFRELSFGTDYFAIAEHHDNDHRR